MSVVRFPLVVCLAVTLTGCINSSTLVKVKPDGSGTIEQILLVNAQALKGMMAGMGGQMKAGAGPGSFSEADFKRTAERMGVKPVSLTPMSENGFEGSKAVFAFDDITKVRVDQDPQMGSSSTPKESPIHFTFARQGNSSVLTVIFDEKKAAGATADMQQKAPSIESMDPQMLQMVKTMFDGFKIAVNLEVEGQIVKTNADYVNGSRVTLLEVEMAGLFEDQEKLKALQGKIGPGATISEIKPYLKDVKGVKINNPTVTIEYR